MKAIAETMEVALSNLKEQAKKADKPKRIRYSEADDEWLLPMIRKVCDSRASYGYRRTLALVNHALLLQGKPKEQAKKADKPKRIRYSEADDEWLLPMIRKVCDSRASYGYRRTLALVNHALLLQGKPKINHKRIYRIMKQNNLLLQRFGRKPIRTHDGKIETIASNVRWCSDGFCIQCWNGDQLYVAFSMDCHDREVMAWVASNRGVDGEMIRDLLTETIENRFGSVDVVPHSVQWLSDNGSCYTSRETVHYGRSRGLEIRTTPAYSPQSNGMAEAFVKTFKRDYVWLADLSSAEKVREHLATWFEDYNEIAPHQGLKMKSPRQYRQALQN